MIADGDAFLSEWHRVVSERDVACLPGLLAEQVSIGAPPYWTKLEGRDLVVHLLGLVIEPIEEFTYRRQWEAGRELALEFTGRVGSLELQGIDLITLDDQFVVENLDVLIRPINAAIALREIVSPQMAEFLAGR